MKIFRDVNCKYFVSFQEVGGYSQDSANSIDISNHLVSASEKEKPTNQPIIPEQIIPDKSNEDVSIVSTKQIMHDETNEIEAKDTTETEETEKKRQKQKQKK